MKISFCKLARYVATLLLQFSIAAGVFLVAPQQAEGAWRAGDHHMLQIAEIKCARMKVHKDDQGPSSASAQDVITNMHFQGVEQKSFSGSLQGKVIDIHITQVPSIGNGNNYSLAESKIYGSYSDYDPDVLNEHKRPPLYEFRYRDGINYVYSSGAEWEFPLTDAATNSDIDIQVTQIKGAGFEENLNFNVGRNGRLYWEEYGDTARICDYGSGKNSRPQIGDTGTAKWEDTLNFELGLKFLGGVLIQFFEYSFGSKKIELNTIGTNRQQEAYGLGPDKPFDEAKIIYYQGTYTPEKVIFSLERKELLNKYNAETDGKEYVEEYPWDQRVQQGKFLDVEYKLILEGDNSRSGEYRLDGYVRQQRGGKWARINIDNGNICLVDDLAYRWWSDEGAEINGRILRPEEKPVERDKEDGGFSCPSDALTFAMGSVGSFEGETMGKAVGPGLISDLFLTWIEFEFEVKGNHVLLSDDGVCDTSTKIAFNVSGNKLVLQNADRTPPGCAYAPIAKNVKFNLKANAGRVQHSFLQFNDTSIHADLIEEKVEKVTLKAPRAVMQGKEFAIQAIPVNAYGIGISGSLASQTHCGFYLDKDMNFLTASYGTTSGRDFPLSHPNYREKFFLKSEETQNVTGSLRCEKKDGTGLAVHEVESGGPSSEYIPVNIEVFLDCEGKEQKDMSDKCAQKIMEPSGCSQIDLKNIGENHCISVYGAAEALPLHKINLIRGMPETGGVNLIAFMIARIANVLVRIAGAIAVFALVYAGFLYVQARGDKSQIDKAKNLIAGVVTALVIIFLAYIIISVVQDIFYGAEKLL